MSEINWDSVKIRCSSLADLFTEPQSKADKEAGNLSKTAKTHLIEVYARELWGVEKDLISKQIKKGREAEESAITLLSRLDKVVYSKNDVKEENEWIKGCCDILTEETVDENKCSWDAFTFLPKLVEPIDKDYFAQIQGYLWLYNRQKGRLRYTLVDTPDFLITGEKYRLLRSMNVISEESPEYIEAARRLESNMKFSHIPFHLRVVTHEIHRDEEFLAKIPGKVGKAREFLKELYEKHMKL
jgi:hypothetical protein